MMSVYRVSVAGKTIHLENWADWTDFDSRRPGPAGFPSDVAHAFGSAPRLDAAGVEFFELQRIRVNNGLGADAKALVEADLLLWEAAGAQVIGAFEVVHGHDLPAILVILGWTNGQDATRAQILLEGDPGSTDRHRDRRIASNRTPIRSSSRLLGCTFSQSAPYEPASASPSGNQTAVVHGKQNSVTKTRRRT